METQPTPTSGPADGSLGQTPNTPTQPANEMPALSSEPKNSRNSHQTLRDILSIAVVILSALVLALGLISFVFQSYEVSGPSMKNTLQNNDHLIVWKVSRTWARITGHPYIPDRGNIIVFNEPGLATYGSDDKQLIKRVIGLPGDHVVVKNGVVTIYNKANPKGFDPDKTLPYGKGKDWPVTSGDIDLTLKANQIFVCGDNRPDSLDSRVFGPVDVNNIIGKLAVRVLPINTMKIF